MNTVAVWPGSGAAFAAAQAAVWASLPSSLRSVVDDAELVTVDGRSGDWVAAAVAAVAGGVTGLLVSRPSCVPAEAVLALEEAARSAGVVVVVEAGWAHPGVGPLAAVIADRVAGPVLVDAVTFVGPDDPRSDGDLLLGQVALLRALVGPLDSVGPVVSDPGGYTAVGRLGPAVVALAGVRSVAPPGARAAVLGPVTEAGLWVPADGTAAPAETWWADADGRHDLPSRYESGARAAWRRLAELVGRSEQPADLADLADLAADLTLTTPPS